jgi:hypothetical protein
MSWLRMVVRVAMGVVVVMACWAGSAMGAVGRAPGPGWVIDSQSEPTNFSTAENAGDVYAVRAINVGGKATDGTPITLVDRLPAGLTVTGISLFASSVERGEPDLGGFGLCSIETVKCEYHEAFFGVVPGSIEPDGWLKMVVHVRVDSGVSGELSNAVEVSGGGAASVSREKTNAISSSPAPFGLSNFDFYIAGQDGSQDTQAGDHPYELSTTIGFANSLRVNSVESNAPTSTEDVKDVLVDLPLGFVGSTLAAPECTFVELSSKAGCPADTVVGHILSEPFGIASVNSPIYNMVPEHGFPAEFAYVDVLEGTHAFYARVVPTPDGYVLQTMNPDIPATGLAHVTVTFYGDPAARQEELAEREKKVPSSRAHVPFFTNPTNCSGGPVTATIYTDSWQHPAQLNTDGTPVNLEEAAWAKMQSVSPAVTGCDLLQFPAEIRSQPTTHEADKPSGMDFEIKLPQSEFIGSPATPTLKKAVVTLPEGFTVDPAAGDGLAACSEAQIGWLGGTHLNFSAAPPACPEASKIGSLEVETPLVAHKLEGEMFLASQDENPFGTTLAAYVVIHDPVTGVLAKIAGEFLPDPVTGRLTAVFDENPNVPFSDLKLHFFGGPRAELATPEACGTFMTGTELFPYSSPDSGPPATPFDSFVIDEGCPSGGFGPSFTGSSLNVQAGAYTPFVASFQRSDTDQELAGLTLTLPHGLLAKVAGVPLCTDAEIHLAEVGDGGCPQASQIGNVVTGVGPGPNPLFVSGKAYLTGPYNGGPYGLAVIVPAIAGPYNFGTVVVRQSIRIDPHTAQVTDVSDAFPTIIHGIPLRLRRVDITLDRSQFTFNPTSCEHLAFNGTITGSPLGAPRHLNGNVGYATQTGASSQFTTPFQVTDCAALKFTPRLQASTKAHSSRLGGASLTVKVSYPKTPWGSEANIGRVKVSLPKQLPSRLSTLQKACTARQFNTNPAGCPTASIVGHAIVHTPVLPAPLEGPAYFVSNGSQAFPNLIMVLQGDNVTFQLVGNTFISKKGVTTSTFNSVPDVPFSTFQITLPQGRYSALAANLPGHANGSFCRQKLQMPITLNAQNGMTIQKTIKLTVTGCKKTQHPTHRKHPKKT